MSYTDDTNWGERFNAAAMQQIASYLSTANHASQTLAIDGGTGPDMQSSGGGAATLNGVLIPALAADAALDISADTTEMDNCTNASGFSVTNGYDVYLLILAAADGTLSVWLAGEQALTTAAVLKVPTFDPETYIAVGTAKIVNDSGSALVIGTNDLDGDITFYDSTYPILPHPDNFLQT